MGGLAKKHPASELATVVPLVKPDLPALSDIQTEIEDILATGQISNFGKYVQRFERESRATWELMSRPYPPARKDFYFPCRRWD